MAINNIGYNFVWLGTTYNFYISKRTVAMPKRRTELYDMSGRNGAWVQDGIYATNATITYEGWMVDDTHDALRARVSGLLGVVYNHTQQGYARLQDTYDGDGFRLAVPCGAPEVNYTAHGTAVTIKLTFSARPEIYTYNGDGYILIGTDSQITINGDNYNRYPLLETTGMGTISIYAGQHDFPEFRITVDVDDEIVHDFEKGSITYKNTGTSAANVVVWKSLNTGKIAIPYLPCGAGSHSVVASGNIYGRIKPRTYHF